MLFHIFLLSNYSIIFFFFFNDTATTEIYTLSLHDALPIYCFNLALKLRILNAQKATKAFVQTFSRIRSEEHTSELQSRENLVCRLLLEKKKKKKKTEIQKNITKINMSKHKDKKIKINECII